MISVLFFDLIKKHVDLQYSCPWFITLVTRINMATYGNVGEFKESEELWTQYTERLEQYFAANEIKDAKKQRAILLGVCGSKTYGLIRDLLQPQKPGDVELKEILEKLENHCFLIRSKKKLHPQCFSQNESAIAAVETTIPRAANTRMKCITNVKRKATWQKYVKEGKRRSR